MAMSASQRVHANVAGAQLNDGMAAWALYGVSDRKDCPGLSVNRAKANRIVAWFCRSPSPVTSFTADSWCTRQPVIAVTMLRGRLSSDEAQLRRWRLPPSAPRSDNPARSMTDGHQVQRQLVQGQWLGG